MCQFKVEEARALGSVVSDLGARTDIRETLVHYKCTYAITVQERARIFFVDLLVFLTTYIGFCRGGYAIAKFEKIE